MNATAICVARGLRSLLLASRETAIRRTVNPTKHPRVLGLISSYSKVCWCPGTGGEVALLEPSLSVYTHIHTYIHTYIRTYMYIYTCIHTYIHTCISYAQVLSILCLKAPKLCFFVRRGGDSGRLGKALAAAVAAVCRAKQAPHGGSQSSECLI